MNALLDHADLSAIRKKAIDTGLAIPPRDPLFMGIDVAVRSMVYSQGPPADALTIEIDRLNTFIDRTETNGYHFAVWLKNAADKLDATKPAEAQFFRAMADKVAAIPPAPKAGPGNTRDVITGAKAEEQSNEEVRLALEVLRTSMPGISRRATNLYVSKRVHDSLHFIQLHVLPLLNTALAAAESNPGIAEGLIVAQLDQMADKTGDLPGEFGILPPDEALRLEAQATYDRLMIDYHAAAVASAPQDITALRSAMAQVSNTVTSAMPVFAREMEVYRRGLDLHVVGEQLKVMADSGAEATLKADAVRLSSTLAAIAQDLNVIGPRHINWQELDGRLVSIEDRYRFLAFGDGVYSAFNLEWEEIDGAIAKLFAGLPAVERERTEILRDEFLAICPVPLTGAPDPRAAQLFANLIKHLRTVFSKIDQRLLDICNQLREVTSQLAQL